MANDSSPDIFSPSNEGAGMRYSMLGSSTLRTSVIGIGGLHFGVFCDQAATTSILRRALDLGVNFVDTAPMYGHGDSESFIKNAIKGRRHDVVISNKVGLEPLIAHDGTFGVSVAPLSRERIRSALEGSLRALGTDYIDLYQVHAFDHKIPIEDTMAALDEFVREGKIRFVGCSNYTHDELNLAKSVAAEHQWAQFVSLQVHYSLMERKAEEDIVPACHATGIGIICYRALARGILTGKYKPNEPLPEGSRAMTSDRVRRWLSNPTLSLVAALDQFAQTCGHSVTELAIAWLLRKADVSVVLAGVRNVDQLEGCVSALQWALSEDEMLEIDAIINNLGLLSYVNTMPETFLET